MLLSDGTGLSRLVKALALPPVGILPGQVHRALRGTGQRLPQLVARHEQTLSRGGMVEGDLLGVGAVGLEPVSALSSVDLLRDLRRLPQQQGKAG